MKKALLLLTAACLTIGTVDAQIANGTILEENVIITDLDGNEHDVFAYLDQGKTVVLDLYATWCGPCWNYHNSTSNHPNGGALKDLYNIYGDGVDGTGEVIVIGVESDPSTPVTAIGGGAGNTNGWNWLTGVPYPMANDNSINNVFEQGYYPYIIRICPNRQIFELGQLSAADIMTDVNECASGFGEINPAVLSYNGTVATCADVDVIVTIQNLGSQNLTSATLEATDANGTLLTYEWSGDLAQYEAEEVNLGTSTITESSLITVSVTSEDDDSEFSSVSQNVALAVESTNIITVNIELDNYPQETSWEIRNSDNSVVASGGPYNGQVLETINEEVDVTNLGCYSFTILDSYGDGLNASIWGGTDGSYTVTSSDGAVIADGGGNDEFEEESSPFDATSFAVGIDDVLVGHSFNVFPNPSTDILNVALELVSSQKVTIDVYDIVGKTVIAQDFGTMSAGYSTQILNVNQLQDGIYMMNVNIGENSIVSKFVVRH